MKAVSTLIRVETAFYFGVIWKTLVVQTKIFVVFAKKLRNMYELSVAKVLTTDNTNMQVLTKNE